MCWWTGIGRRLEYEAEDLRVLSSHIATQCEIILGHEFRSVLGCANVREPYKINHDHRPAIVAVLVAMIDEAPKEYPDSGRLAALIHKCEIAESKKDADDTKLFIRIMEPGVSQMFKGGRIDPRRHKYKIDSDTSIAIKKFAIVLTIALRNYGECIRKNIDVAAAAGLNLAFSIDYLALVLEHEAGLPVEREAK